MNRNFKQSMIQKYAGIKFNKDKIDITKCDKKVYFKILTDVHNYVKGNYHG